MALVCTSVSLVLVAPGTPATAGGGGDELEQVEAKLAACKRDLAQARQAARDADAFLALVRKRQLVIVKVAGIYFPVNLEQYRDMLILQFVTGKISKSELTKALQAMVRELSASLRALAALRDEAREDVEKVSKRCTALAEQRDRLRRAGGGGGGGTTGAYPGSTATKLSLTIKEVTVTRNLVTGGQTPAIRNVTGTQRGTVSGAVELDGTLPKGWNVYVSFSGGLVRTGQGPFTIKDPIGSQRGDNATATICPKPPPPPPAFPLCEAARNGIITLGWTWVP